MPATSTNSYASQFISTSTLYSIDVEPVTKNHCIISQVSYQTNQIAMCKKACSILWEYFVTESPVLASETYTTCAQKDFQLKLYRWVSVLM